MLKFKLSERHANSSMTSNLQDVEFIPAQNHVACVYLLFIGVGSQKFTFQRTDMTLLKLVLMTALSMMKSH